MSHALTLYRLQQTDSRIDQAQARLKVIHETLENDSALKAAREALEKAQGGLHAAERGLRETEMDVKTQQIKIEQVESSLYSGRIHNPKELQDLQNDSASLKRHLLVLEERQLESMLALDTAREEFAAAQAAYTAAQSQAATRNASLNGEQTTLLKDTERLAAERNAITATIDPSDLALYSQIREQRRGVAVALIGENACEACGAMLTPAQAQSVRISPQLSRCPSCGRILFSK
jgi:predicted  nucleic acid-binding Zn-ribbon protein